MERIVGLLVLGLVAVTALPYDPVVRKLNEGPQYQYVENPDGSPRLANTWMTVSDVAEAGRFDPDRQNSYHLFTRQNPTVSQPLLMGSTALLGLTNYNSARRTIVLVHGWLGSVISDVNTVLIPAFLAAEDVNIIAVDWSVGADTANYIAAVGNTAPSGRSVARFIAWLNEATGAVHSMYHLVGHSLGGHKVGVIGRTLGGTIAYITALDPSFTGWIFHDDKFRPGDGAYTEIIHTNAGLLGYIGTLGHSDFYPNGGINMPGCNSQECDHSRSFHYMAESLTTGRFVGRRCATYVAAMAGGCLLWGNLHMGGLVPKTGSSGIYHLETNARPPFARG